MRKREKTLCEVRKEVGQAWLNFRDAVARELGLFKLLDKMSDWLNRRRVEAQTSNYVRAKEILNIASLTNRGIFSPVDISLTDQECQALGREPPYSYTEIKAVFFNPKKQRS